MGMTCVVVGSDQDTAAAVGSRPVAGPYDGAGVQKSGRHVNGKENQSPGKGAKGTPEPKLMRLKDLPSKVWTEVPNDCCGVQFTTRGSFGGQSWPIMLDGGSGLNSIPEMTLVSILNYQRGGGRKLSDPTHPV